MLREQNFPRHTMMLLGLAFLAAGMAGWAGEKEKNSRAVVKLYPIVKDGKWGYMNREGKVVIKPLYDQAFDFSEGLACVTTYPWRGYIDSTGKMVIEAQFTWAGPFKEGLAPVKCHSKFYGRHANYYGGAASSSKELDVKNVIKKSCFIDYAGKSSKGLPFSTSGVGDGKVLITTRTKTQVYGLNGKRFKTDADQVCQFSNGLAAARKNHKWGFLDHSMKWAIEPQFDAADGFFEDIAFVAKSSIPFPKDTKYRSIKAWKEKRTLSWGYIDKTGKLLKDYAYDDAWRFSEGMASVKIAGKWGYINKEGALQIQPTYDYAWPFSEGMARVMVKEKQGFINLKGVLVIEPAYRPAWDFLKGLARVQLKDNEGIKEGYLDKSGAFVWKPSK